LRVSMPHSFASEVFAPISPEHFEAGLLAILSSSDGRYARNCGRLSGHLQYPRSSRRNESNGVAQRLDQIGRRRIKLEGGCFLPGRAVTRPAHHLEKVRGFFHHRRIAHVDAAFLRPYDLVEQESIKLSSPSRVNKPALLLSYCPECVWRGKRQDAISSSPAFTSRGFFVAYQIRQDHEMDGFVAGGTVSEGSCQFPTHHVLHLWYSITDILCMLEELIRRMREIIRLTHEIIEVTRHPFPSARSPL